MKTTITLIAISLSAMIYAQDCQPFTASKEVIHGKIKYNILRASDGNLNPIYIKTGIGPTGDIDTRTYAPLIKSSNIWAGGIDPAGNLKLTATTANNQDWSPGPLNDYTQTDSITCAVWDRIWTVTKEEILEAVDIFGNNGSCDQIPINILEWPGKDNPHLDYLPAGQYFADFYDRNEDGKYDPCDGDFPHITKNNYCYIQQASEILLHTPSQFSFHMMNDYGAAHHVSLGTPIGLQVHEYTFTFNAQEAEGIIFYKHLFKYKNPSDLRDFKFAKWLDFELGCGNNDKPGSVEDQKMIYAYNGSSEDNCGPNALGNQSAMVGFNYLTGIKGIYLIVEGSDGQDSLVTPDIGSGIYDTLVTLGASNAMIPTNCLDASTPKNCNPQTSTDYYNLIFSKNFDGSPVIDNNGVPSSFLFSGNPASQDEWSLCTDTSQPESTAILSFEKIMLQPSATNSIFSAIYYTDDVDNNCPDIAAIKYKNRIAHQIHNNCYFNYNGPPAPNLEVYYTDQGVDINLNNIPFDYIEYVPESDPESHTDRRYTFEGVKIYQVASKNFDMTELNNPDLSVLVYQGDINNDITEISNFRSDFVGGTQTWIEDPKVTGANTDIDLNISISYDYIRDQAISPIDKLYYVAVSYAYNNYEEFDPLGSVDNDGNIIPTGQQYKYLETNSGLQATESVINTSTNKTILIDEKYKFEYFENTINLFDVQADLKLQLYAIDGKSLDQWNVRMGDTFTLNDLSSQVLPGIYILNVCSADLSSHKSHKIIVMK